MDVWVCGWRGRTCVRACDGACVRPCDGACVRANAMGPGAAPAEKRFFHFVSHHSVSHKAVILITSIPSQNSRPALPSETIASSAS